MKIIQESECVKCDHILDETCAFCPKCGRWQPHGDKAVAALRAIRLRDFQEQELKAERALLAMRHTPQARAGREPITFRLRREFHLAKFNARPIIAAIVFTFALTATGSWLVFGGGQKGRAEASRSVSTREVAPAPTAKCRDGSDWFGTSRRGACSGRNGVAVFYTAAND